MIGAIAWKFQTGSQGAHLREKYGNWRGVSNRLRMWAADGTWARVFTALIAQADADEDVNGVASVDSRTVRAHQHAAEAREKEPWPTSPEAGHPPSNREAYQQRDTVERCIDRLKRWRGIATR